MTTSNSQKQINFISKKTLIMNTKYPNKVKFTNVFQLFQRLLMNQKYNLFPFLNLSSLRNSH